MTPTKVNTKKRATSFYPCVWLFAFLPSLAVSFSPFSPLFDAIFNQRNCWQKTTATRIRPNPSFTLTATSRSRRQFLKQADENEDAVLGGIGQVDAADDLTCEELNSRFDEVLTHYRETQEMTPTNVCQSMLRTRLPQLRLNRCRVGNSTIPGAGFGLFAIRDIEPGELITCFPGDALLLWTNSVGDFSGDVGIMVGPHVNAQALDLQQDVTSDVARSYELKIGELESLVADPTRIDDAAYLGHMANDKVMLTKLDLKSRQAYSKSTFEGHNAAFFDMLGCHLATIATKRISKDEEIFVSYGEGYWMSRIPADSNANKGMASTKKAKKKTKRR